ncbi:unnamed protein product [Camellia sinensis]
MREKMGLSQILDPLALYAHYSIMLESGPRQSRHSVQGHSPLIRSQGRVVPLHICSRFALQALRSRKYALLISLLIDHSLADFN